ncbi:hypothetical protein JKG68_05875 [Microvirga aerilata]|jgi:hypothetical protein|uniref:UrcA family protein n=1 Tax=Microvirga aerilata TaxID=670292 RepID=A0A936Z5Y0_9HYPH|nr:hypothetical protein [Microvirga aerilata]MBL0403488.1 hypothetical protein [Microvirga aerilata]
MRKILGVLAVAGLTVLGAGTASAQGVGVQIGPGGVRVVQERHHAPRYRERVIERRVVRPARTRTVCRTVMEERVRPSGVVVRRPVERCREVVAGRRVYVD